MNVQDLRLYFTGVNLAQIGVLWFLVYWTLRYLETTIAGSFLRSIGFFAILGILFAVKMFDLLGMAALSQIFTYFIVFTFISVVIIFQPEFRHGISRLNRTQFSRFLRRMGIEAGDAGPSAEDEICRAARRFGKNHVGSMVVVEREITLQPYIDRSVRIDAAVRAELLDTIFTTPTLLHDGAVIIRGDRIEAAGAVLPLTQNPSLPKRYGTRHRAAMGITEESDAVVIVTSEETGAISLVYGGQLFPQEDTVKMEETLKLLLSGEEIPTA
ncbi:MAG: diadenylate cyclase CdaA [Planctomycetota bacterium]